MKEESKRIWKYYLENAVVGSAPVLREGWLRRLAGRLMRYRALVIRRSLDYHDAGCPIDLCESAAARDLWNASISLPSGPPENDSEASA